MAEDELRLLLIEDNDSDAVLIKKYLERLDDTSFSKDLFVSHTYNLSSGTKHLRGDETTDLVLLDLDLPESSGIDTLRWFMIEFDDVPVIVLTGIDDKKTDIKTIREGAQDYLNKNKIDTEELGQAIRYAMARRKRERKSERREDLRKMIQEVLIASATRESIEKRFCRKIVQHEPYAFAWISGSNTEGDSVVRASSKTDHVYLDNVLSCDATAGFDTEPSVRAAQDMEPVLIQNIGDTDAPWADIATKTGFASVASVPLVHRNVLYGILSVYSDRPGFFNPIEGKVLVDVADSLSYSINIVAKERAIMSEDMTEVEIRLDSSVSYLSDLLKGTEDTVDVRVRGTVPTDGGVLQFVDIKGDSSGSFVVGADDMPQNVEEIERVHSEDGAETYQITVSGPTLQSHLLSLGAVVRSTEVSEKVIDIRAEVPPEVGIANVVDEIEDVFGYGRVTMCRGTGPEEDGVERILRFDAEGLTDKQSEALQTAYYRGYFEQPKKNSADEIADALGVSRSTFLQHLRVAQRKTYKDLFG
jgi:predicted DNA binding protein/DNA-binding NarL/FixJ family response regulator